MRKVTIEDISRLTGLSRGTVSRALNNRPDISSKTKAIVLEACTKLEYVPSVAARALATGRHFEIALVLAEPLTFATGEQVRGILRAANARNFAVQLVELSDEPAARRERLHRLVADRVDGILLVGAITDECAIVLNAALDGRSLLTTISISRFACDVAGADHEAAGALAAAHVADTPGAIVFLKRAADPSARWREAAFLAGIRQRDGARGATTHEITGEQGLALHADAIRSAAIIVASDDELAATAALFCSQLGRKIGGDVAILGFGNQPIGAETKPSLSTVDLRYYEAGQAAAETLLQRVESSEPPPVSLRMVEPFLITRDSTSRNA